jgi:hypothetical protein
MGSGGIPNVFLTSELDGSDFTLRPLYLRKRVPGTHWIGGWVDSRADPKAVAKRNNPCRESSLGRPTRSLVTILTELSRLLCITCMCIIALDGRIICSVTEINRHYSPIRPPYFSWTCVSKNWEHVAPTAGLVTERLLQLSVLKLTIEYIDITINIAYICSLYPKLPPTLFV